MVLHELNIVVLNTDVVTNKVHVSFINDKLDAVRCSGHAFNGAVSPSPQSRAIFGSTFYIDHYENRALDIGAWQRRWGVPGKVRNEGYDYDPRRDGVTNQPMNLVLHGHHKTVYLGQQKKLQESMIGTAGKGKETPFAASVERQSKESNKTRMEIRSHYVQSSN
ncbi:hypothetical protein C8R44DRAFT_728947 [Mycena epipterygia]|nr:hypothetical protein C8R44DRAFT_728947 [Mycena epipterygia]